MFEYGDYDGWITYQPPNYLITNPLYYNSIYNYNNNSNNKSAHKHIYNDSYNDHHIMF